MATMTMINHADLAFFDRLATMTSSRQEILSPPKVFFTTEQRLETSIMDFHAKCSDECCPERAVAFSIEYLPWADHNGEHDDIVTTTIVGHIDHDLGLALIYHMATTGEPMAPADLIEAVNLFHYVNRVCAAFLLLGVVFGVLGMAIAALP